MYRIAREIVGWVFLAVMALRGNGGHIPVSLFAGEACGVDMPAVLLAPGEGV